MKTSIKLTAMALLFSAGAFAATPQPNHHKTATNMGKPLVSIILLRYNAGFAVRVDQRIPEKMSVIIYDQDMNEVFRDRLTKGPSTEKAYLLRQLGYGKYTLEVFSKGRDIKRNFVIYANSHTNRRVIDIM
jgi:hypothetical protein